MVCSVRSPWQYRLVQCTQFTSAQTALAQQHMCLMMAHLEPALQARSEGGQLGEDDVIIPLLKNEVHTTWLRHAPHNNVAGFMQDLDLGPVLRQNYT